DSHRITLLYNGNLVVGIADTYSHLTQTNGLVGGVARAGVLLNVLVELLQVGKGLVFAPELNQSGDEVIGCTGGTGVGHLDFTLQLRPEQILPGGWRLDAELSQTLVVGDKAQGTNIQADPVAFRILELFGNVLGVGREILFGQAHILS